jgi:hypothetical protein
VAHEVLVPLVNVDWLKRVAGASSAMTINSKF